MTIVLVEGVAVEGWQMATIHRRRRGARDGRVRAIRVAVGRLLGRAPMAVKSKRWCSGLRSHLVEAIGVEGSLRRRVNAAQVDLIARIRCDLPSSSRLALSRNS